MALIEKKLLPLRPGVANNVTATVSTTINADRSGFDKRSQSCCLQHQLEGGLFSSFFFAGAGTSRKDQYICRRCCSQEKA